MKGITKLEISRYDQISSCRPLENAYHAATGECSEIEIENNLFVKENGDLYTASDTLVDWYYRAVYNSLADDIVIIIDHENQTAFITDEPDKYPDAHERKWQRYGITLYHNDTEKEFTNFGDEYKIDEIKSKADKLIAKYVDEHQHGTWEQPSEHKHRRKIGEYSVEIYVIP